MKKFTSERLELVRNAAIVGDFIWLNISLIVVYVLADWGEPEAARQIRKMSLPMWLTFSKVKDGCNI